MYVTLNSWAHLYGVGLVMCDGFSAAQGLREGKHSVLISRRLVSLIPARLLSQTLLYVRLRLLSLLLLLLLAIGLSLPLPVLGQLLETRHKHTLMSHKNTHTNRTIVQKPVKRPTVKRHSFVKLRRIMIVDQHRNLPAFCHGKSSALTGLAPQTCIKTDICFVNMRPHTVTSFCSSLI